jgi:hypothetical protein
LTINLIAAALGLNELATTEKSKYMKILERTSMTETLEIKNAQFGNANQTISGTFIQSYSFTNSKGCEDIGESLLLDISDDDCNDIRTATVAWLGLCVIAISAYYSSCL